MLLATRPYTQARLFCHGSTHTLSMLRRPWVVYAAGSSTNVTPSLTLAEGRQKGRS